MSILDFIILIPLIYFAWRGFVNGIIKEVLSIAGIVLAVFLAFKFMDDFSMIIRPLFSDSASSYIPFISGALIFVLTVSAVQILAFTSKKFLELIKLNAINRVLGLAFGFLKSAIAVSTLLLILAGFGFPSSESRENSFTYSAVINIAPLTFDAVAALFPGVENFSETVKKNISEYNPIKNFPALDD